jgi:competence protein ComQ
MDQRVLEEMDRIINEYFHVQDLNRLLKVFIQDKAKEGSLWYELTLQSHYMLDGCSEHIYKAAAQTELLILALDIMDDLQDQDNGDKPWMQCDTAYTLNAIIAFFTASLADLSKIKGQHTAKLLQLLARSINGQQQDLNHSIMTENAYITMIQEKSGSLINLAFYMGYLYIDDCNSAITEQMDELAQYIGIAAQIKNDIRDLLRWDLKNDLFQKKRTLPILFLLQQNAEKCSPIHLYYEGRITRESFLESKHECLQYITESGGIEYAKTIQYLYVNKVEQLFELLYLDSHWKDKLKETVLAAIGD